MSMIKMGNKIFEEMKEEIGEIDKAIEDLIPRGFDGWLEEMFGESRWVYDIGALDGAIAKPVWNLLDRGGKRWRPFLMKLCYESVGGDGVIDKFLPIVEVIHNGTLMIDDIEDGSDVRRGSSCIHKIYGEDVAINAGNAMYYLPMLSVMRDDSLDLKMKIRIYELVNEEMIKISFGQGMDIFWHGGGGVPSEKEYLQMCAFKTGTLARMAAKLGGILGGASDEVVEALGEFAESLGVAFQIQDDILNVCPSENWGKDFGDDISEGKRTLLVIRALDVLDKEKIKDLIGILDLKTKNKVLIGEAVAMIRNSDAISYSDKVARNLVREAWVKLDEILVASDVKDKLKMFSDFVVEREI